ncbi:MAG TPA: class I SAM-dependent methyltransferase [Terriglobia bacterium]|jgi:2-polyprenyl-3-methyl-5-hydroxy-6-metoxy-1,4-benzoquinol methylase|nr:class I SAM-dependent methyltransferase [Terriglobia bacterium]
MATTGTALSYDESKLNVFMEKVVHDLGAAMHATLILVGDKLGLYRAMAETGPVTAAELAKKTNTTERYVREWLNANAASGYATYDPATQRYELPPEQAFALTVMDIPGAFHIISACFKDEPKITQAFRTGDGVGWHEHDANLFFGTERFFRPNYAANLVSSWIPALHDVEPKLKAGAAVADVGCGHGASTLLMAKAFPRSRFSGFDYHSGSVEYARHVAGRDGLQDQVIFEVASSKSYPGNGGYDLVTFFDCLHDMGDPTGAAKHVLSTLKPDGTWMIVEPFANDHPEQNHNPVGRIYYSASTMICTPASLAQEVGAALGAQAGEEQIRAVVTGAGFTRFRRAAETPFNLVFEARP